MTNHQSSEDYLEAILLLSRELKFVHQIDVARRIGVSQPAVKKAMNVLLAGGYIKMDGLHISLTPSGEEYASEVYSRHCTIRDFLKRHGVSSSTADSDACEIEHVISPETITMMKAWLSANPEAETEPGQDGAAAEGETAEPETAAEGDISGSEPEDGE